MNDETQTQAQEAPSAKKRTDEEKGTVQISMTLPKVVVQAMDRKGRIFGMKGWEWLKQSVLASAWGADTALRLGPIVEDIAKNGEEGEAASQEELPIS